MKSPTAPLLRLALLGLAAVACLSGCGSGSPSSTEAAGQDLAARPSAEEARLGQALEAEAARTLVVDLRDGITKAEFDAWEGAMGVDLEFNSEEGRVTGITLARDVADPAGALERLRRHPAVEAAEHLQVYTASFTPNDPDWDRQWNLKLVDMPKAWERTRGKGVVVAVLDTGIAYEDRGDFRRVPDLKGARFVEGYDFVNDTRHANDDHGHGTHVAGTIAQVTDNGLGVAGIAHEATLMPVKVLNHFGAGTSADIADAIRFAADRGAKVINLSLGGGSYSSVMAGAVAYARKKGAVVVAAAGNRGVGHVEFPAAYPGAVAVGAVGPDGHRAPYSSYGKELDLAAPGGNKSLGGEAGGILQNTIDPRDPSKSVYAAYQGTSMATPHVAGVAALLIAAGAKSPDAVEKALFAGAKPIGGKAWSEEYGHGLLNAERSLIALKGEAADTEWGPFVWASVLLAAVLLTLRGRVRPGYLNVLFGLKFLLPLLLTTVGAFFLRWFGSSEVLETASLPLPDLERIIFGRGRLANPLVYSALIPVLFSFLAIARKSLRPVAAGVAIGFAGLLGYAAWVHAPALAWLPFTVLAVPWLAVNALICLVMARALLQREPA